MGTSFACWSSGLDASNDFMSSSIYTIECPAVRLQLTGQRAFFLQPHLLLGGARRAHDHFPRTTEHPIGSHGFEGYCVGCPATASDRVRPYRNPQPRWELSPQGAFSCRTTLLDSRVEIATMLSMLHSLFFFSLFFSNRGLQRCLWCLEGRGISSPLHHQTSLWKLTPFGNLGFDFGNLAFPVSRLSCTKQARCLHVLCCHISVTEKTQKFPESVVLAFSVSEATPFDVWPPY